MSATTTPGPLAATEALLKALAAAQHFRQTGELPSWATNAEEAAPKDGPL